MTAFNEFGKGLQVAVVGLAGERPQPFFHAKVNLVVLQQREIASGFHTSIMGVHDILLAEQRTLPNLFHQGINFVTALFCRDPRENGNVCTARYIEASGSFTSLPVRRASSVEDNG